MGPGNDAAIVAAARSADVVAAWGVHARFGARNAEVLELLADAGVSLHYLRLTKDGLPGHPLYVPGNTLPTMWVRP